MAFRGHFFNENSMEDKEVFEDGPFEFAREGKNIFMRNHMTEEEHQAWLQQLTRNRPLAYRETRELIDEAVELINRFDKVFVLGGISSVGTHKFQSGEDEEASEIVMEYAQSIAMATPNISKGKLPDQGSLIRIYDLLVKIRHYLHAYYAIEHLEKKYTPVEYQMRFAMIGETMFIRGAGYLRHTEELYREMFMPHDAFFEKHYGFKSSDIVQTFKQVEASFTLRVASPDGKPHPFFEFKVEQWHFLTQGKGKFPEDFAAANPGVYVEDGKLMLYPLTWITYFDKLYRIRHHNSVQEKVVNLLSLAFGDNKSFAQYNAYEMLNPSEIFTKPFVRDEEGNYYLFSMNIGARNYFNIAQQLIRAADEKYYQQYFLGSKHSCTKDRFIEHKVTQLFQKMLPGVSFHPNVKYTYQHGDIGLKCAKAEDGKYELDILGVSDQATYLIEVKAGLLNEDSRRGAIKSIKTNLSQIVGDAVCQSYRAFQYIKTEEENVCFTTTDRKAVKPLNRQRIFRISVSFSYIGSVISSLIKLKEFGAIDAKADLAWTVNIFDLIPFSEVIASEEELIDYLTKRIPMYEDKRIEEVDEMAMLGLYYDNDLTIDPAFEGYRTVKLNGYTNELDRYFDYGGPKPRKRIANP